MTVLPKVVGDVTYIVMGVNLIDSPFLIPVNIRLLCLKLAGRRNGECVKRIK